MSGRSSHTLLGVLLNLSGQRQRYSRCRYASLRALLRYRRLLLSVVR